MQQTKGRDSLEKSNARKTRLWRGKRNGIEAQIARGERSVVYVGYTSSSLRATLRNPDPRFVGSWGSWLFEKLSELPLSIIQPTLRRYLTLLFRSQTYSESENHSLHLQIRFPTDISISSRILLYTRFILARAPVRKLNR